MDLRLERTAARVKQQDVAAQMGRSRATVIRYEGLAIVPDAIARDYRNALATLIDLARAA